MTQEQRRSFEVKKLQDAETALAVRKRANQSSVEIATARLSVPAELSTKSTELLSC